MADETPPTTEEQLVETIVERLRDAGVPAGTWLVDVAQARDALRRADEVLLSSMQRAIERQAADG